MPFKSKAQMRKFFAMYNRGEISKKTLDKWLKHTPNKKNLPERVGKKSAINMGEIIEVEGETIGVNPKKLAYACLSKVAENLNIKDEEELLTILKGMNAYLSKIQNLPYENDHLEKAACLVRSKFLEDGKIEKIRKIAEMMEDVKLEKKGSWIQLALGKLGVPAGMIAAGVTGTGAVIGTLAGLAVLGSAFLPYLAGRMVGKALAQVKNKELEHDIELAGTTSLIAHLQEKTENIKRQRKLKERIHQYQEKHPEEEIVVI